MAWSSSNRRARLPPDWPARRTATRQRAGNRCEHRDRAGQRCIAVGTDCDHITPGDDHELANLQWLCRRHHQAKTAAESAAARSAAHARAVHPDARLAHPGLR